eukprot:jgi/Galph1/2966/GphlegSOOS_G1633.1
MLRIGDNNVGPFRRILQGQQINAEKINKENNNEEGWDDWLVQLGKGSNAEDVVQEQQPDKISSGSSMTAKNSLPSIVLFEMESCPYCKKIRVVLDYYKLPYSCVQVTAVGKRELKVTGARNVPVLLVNNEEIHQSYAMLWKIQEFVDDSMKEDQKAIPAVERKWLYGTDDRLIPLIIPNITHSLGESYQSMKYLLSVDRYSWLQKMSVNLLGPFFLYFMGKQKKWSLQLGDERAALYDAVNEWVGDIGNNAYLLGERPCLADLCVYAFLLSLQPFDVMTDLKEHTNILPWLQRMQVVVGPSQKIQNVKPKKQLWTMAS